MASNELTQLQASCTDAHKAYRAARVALAAAVNKSPDSDAVAELVTSTQELGLNATLHRLKSDDPKVADAIATMVESSDALSLAVGAREQLLVAKNPKHQRVYVEDGREFTLDVEKGLWTYLDDPDHPLKVTVTRETKLPYDIPGFKAPDIEPAELAKKKKLKPRI